MAANCRRKSSASTSIPKGSTSCFYAEGDFCTVDPPNPSSLPALYTTHAFEGAIAINLC